VQVMANDVAVGFGGAGGYLEMNVYKPLMIANITQSITLLSDGCTNFRKFLIEGTQPNRKKIAEYVNRSLMLVTALAPVIGYDKASKIAHYAMDNDLTLKTAALHRVEELGTKPGAEQVNRLAAGFQDSVAEVLAVKTAAAAREFGVRGVVLCGGVAANSAVRERLRDAVCAEAPLFVPPPALCTDNGAMIAAAGYYRLADAVSPAQSPDVQPGLALPTVVTAPT